MKIGLMFPSKYLKSAEIEGQVFSLTVAKVSIENVGDDSGDKPVLYFVGAQKGMVLNRTNAGTLEWLYGAESDDWVGKPIELFTEMTAYMGRPCLGLRLRGPNAPAAVPGATMGGGLPGGHQAPVTQARGPGEQAAAELKQGTARVPDTITSDLEDELQDSVPF